MYRKIIGKLRCPTCSTNIKVDVINEETDEIKDEVLSCDKGHEWYIHDGILDFNCEEQSQ